MSLLPLFPHLQRISRGLYELNSSVSFRYSSSTIRLSWNPPTKKQKRIGQIIVGVFAGVWFSIGIYHAAYLMLILAALTGLVVWLYQDSQKNDIHGLRLQNDIQVDSVAQQILVEHLNTAYRQQVAEQQVISFRDVQAVHVQAAGYAGILYLELADAHRLFLLELEAEQIAQQVADVLRQIIGLPASTRQTWWPF